MSSKTLEQVADSRYKAEMCGIVVGIVAAVVFIGWVICTLMTHP